jgi:hypothetical protein
VVATWVVLVPVVAVGAVGVPVKAGEASGALAARSVTKFVTCDSAIFGMSAATRARKAGDAAAPLDGPAHTVFADSLAVESVRVPLVLTGEPETVNSGEAARPTLVTVPDPAPVVGMSTFASARKVGAAAAPEAGPAHTVFADSLAFTKVKVPLLVTGDPETVNSGGAAKPTLVTVPVPATGGLAAVV